LNKNIQFFGKAMRLASFFGKMFFLCGKIAIFAAINSE
jgi:hypothetical protein